MLHVASIPAQTDFLSLSLEILFSLAALSIWTAFADESHEITFTNNCGYGTPVLSDQGGNILSRGTTYSAKTSLAGLRAYLQDGKCTEPDGVGCGLIEMTLKNPDGQGGQESVNLSLIPPNNFTEAIGFQYTGVCTDKGAYCAEAGCTTAYQVSNDDCTIVTCEEANAGVNVIFCPSEATHFTVSQSGSPCH